MMKRLLAVVWSLCSLCAVARGEYRSVEAAEFASIISDTTVYLLDVRSEQEFAGGHLPGAVCLDVTEDDFADRAAQLLPRERTIALYCRSGRRSKKAADMLSAAGYRVVELSTGWLGWLAWKEQLRPVVVMTTTMGEITLQLYNETPLHRDNFLKLVDEHVYDGLLFHRVIPGFMIQGGDTHSKDAKPGVLLGDGDLPYSIPAEFRVEEGLTHNAYTLAAAREGDDTNPEKESSSTQFYITQTATHRLDGGYTVFGRVISGTEVVDAIANVPRDSHDRPLEDVRILSVVRLR